MKKEKVIKYLGYALVSTLFVNGLFVSSSKIENVNAEIIDEPTSIIEEVEENINEVNKEIDVDIKSEIERERETKVRNYFVNIIDAHVDNSFIDQEKYEELLNYLQFDNDKNKEIISAFLRDYLFKNFDFHGFEDNKLSGRNYRYVLDDRFCLLTSNSVTSFENIIGNDISYSFDENGYDTYDISINFSTQAEYDLLKVSFQPATLTLSWDLYVRDQETITKSIVVSDIMLQNLVKVFYGIDSDSKIEEIIYRLEKIELGINPFDKSEENIYINESYAIARKEFLNALNEDITDPYPNIEKYIEIIKDDNDEVNSIISAFLKKYISEGYNFEIIDEYDFIEAEKDNNEIIIFNSFINFKSGNNESSFIFSNYLDNLRYSQLYIKNTNNENLNKLIVYFYPKSGEIEYEIIILNKKVEGTITISNNELYKAVANILLNINENTTIEEVYSYLYLLNININPLEVDNIYSNIDELISDVEKQIEEENERLNKVKNYYIEALSEFTNNDNIDLEEYQTLINYLSKDGIEEIDSLIDAYIKKYLSEGYKFKLSDGLLDDYIYSHGNSIFDNEFIFVYKDSIHHDFLNGNIFRIWHFLDEPRNEYYASISPDKMGYLYLKFYPDTGMCEYRYFDVYIPGDVTKTFIITDDEMLKNFMKILASINDNTNAIDMRDMLEKLELGKDPFSRISNPNGLPLISLSKKRK